MFGPSEAQQRRLDEEAAARHADERVTPEVIAAARQVGMAPERYVAFRDGRDITEWPTAVG